MPSRGLGHPWQYGVPCACFNVRAMHPCGLRHTKHVCCAHIRTLLLLYSRLQARSQAGCHAPLACSRARTSRPGPVNPFSSCRARSCKPFHRLSAADCDRRRATWCEGMTGGRQSISNGEQRHPALGHRKYELHGGSPHQTLQQQG